MYSGRSNDYNDLDRIRINEGADRCRAAFSEVCRKGAGNAATLLNDDRLMFPSLYILRRQIEDQGILDDLNPRNTAALQIARRLSDPGRSGANALSSLPGLTRPIFQWILATGSAPEIPEDDYEEIIDVTVSVLINTYGDRTILPQVADLIFTRNRNGRYIHDLVWAFFRVHDPQALKLVAEHIRSPDPRDRALAAELLNLDEVDIPADQGDREGRHAGYLRWLEENEPYLYFPEESFQYASQPAFSAVDLERKYLQKGDSSYDKQPLSSSAEEGKALAVFKQLGAEEQKVLSAHSKKIHDKSVPAWKEWLNAPVSEQIEAAKAGSEEKK